MVTGGGAMFLNDGIAKSKIKGVFNHHEQACAMAALGYTKVSNKVGVVMPTTGCGSTNTITGLLDAWQDSNSVLFISGNVNKKEMTYYSDVPLRKFGVQEANILEIVDSITKYSVCIDEPSDIAYELERAWHICTTGRRGPVWVDIPLDVQGKLVDEDDLIHFSPPSLKENEPDYSDLARMLVDSSRPVIIAGYGIHLGDAREEFLGFVERHKIPCTFTYLGVDLLPSSDALHIGRLGTKGTRAGNFAVQNADLVLVLGSSLSVSVTGFRYETFAPKAKVVVIDIDENEHNKGTVRVDLFIKDDVKRFLKKKFKLRDISGWAAKCLHWKESWGGLKKEMISKDRINIYQFLDALSKNIKKGIVVSDAGSAYYCTSQFISLNSQSRYITSGAQADMGFTIPCSIGVSIAGNDVYGVTGDGSFQMNIQELQTIVNYNLPIKLFVLNNGGYLSIRNTMDKFFNSRYMGVDEKTGIRLPDLHKIANAYGIPFYRLATAKDLDIVLPWVMRDHMAIVEVMCPYKQDVVPSSSAKEVDGKLTSQPLDNMYPFLSDEEYKKESQ